MTVGIRHDDLRKRNRAMVIAAVRRTGQPSRTGIARATGLSHSTISAIASDLIGEGVLVETKGEGATTTRRGRPQIALGLNPAAARIVTVSLSFNTLTARLTDYAGETVAEAHQRLATLEIAKKDLVEAVISAIRGLLAGHRTDSPLMGIALGVQGITDSKAQALLWSPITPHSDIVFGQALTKAFGVPVTVNNDCNMIAVALQWRNPDRYRDNFLAILLSNGIGMGLMLKGALFTGTHSSAGEFGHMIHRPHGALCRCGRRGCIEAYAGNYAIRRKASGAPEDKRPAADIAPAEMETLAEAARRTDGAERAAFRAAGEAIGYGLGSLFALIDPVPVALVGHGSSALDLMEPVIRDAIARTAGGQHVEAISFDMEPNEAPLIHVGCAITALRGLDRDVFAQGSVAGPARREEVA